MSAEFEIADDRCTGHLLQPQETCLVVVRIKPQLVGIKDAHLHVCASPYELAVAGLAGDGRPD